MEEEPNSVRNILKGLLTQIAIFKLMKKKKLRMVMRWKKLHSDTALILYCAYICKIIWRMNDVGMKKEDLKYFNDWQYIIIAKQIYKQLRFYLKRINRI